MKERGDRQKKGKELDAFLENKKNSEKEKEFLNLEKVKGDLKSEQEENSKNLSQAVWNKNLINMDF